jgi:uncharacterized membrane protein YdbT with pleckstrin-like domain
VELIAGETILFRGRPSWKSSIGFFMKWGFLAIVPAIVAIVLSSFDTETGLPIWQWVLISLLLVALVILRDAIRRATARYTVTSERIHIRRGLLSRSEQATNLERVQNVSTDQSLLERMLGIGDVDFDTAGTGEGNDAFRFAGIDDPHGVIKRIQQYRLAESPRSQGL